MFALSLNKTTRHRLPVCLLLLTGLLEAGGGVFPASAQQPDSVEGDTTRSVASVERRSTVRAVLYSAGGTFLLTPLFGPAVGHFYADNSEQAWRGIALRSDGFALAGIFGLVGLGQAHAGEEESGITAARIMINLVALHAIYDVVKAWHSAKEYNESHNVSAQVAPTVGPQGERVGLALQVSFSAHRSGDPGSSIRSLSGIPILLSPLQRRKCAFATRKT